MTLKIKSVLWDDDTQKYLVIIENGKEFLFEESQIRDALAGVRHEILRRIRAENVEGKGKYETKPTIE